MYIFLHVSQVLDKLLTELIVYIAGLEYISYPIIVPNMQAPLALLYNGSKLGPLFISE
jgi:hypothetical protein